MQTVFSRLKAGLRHLDGMQIEGRVQSVGGMALTIAGLDRALAIGQRVTVQGNRGPVQAEVVAIGGTAAGGVRVLPFGAWDGVSAGNRVVVCPGDAAIHPDASWIGHVVDALGRVVAPSDLFREGDSPRPVQADPPPAFDRRRVGAKLETGVKAVDVFTPLCRGQRMGVFAGSGVGKSTLMAMLARQTDAEVIVIGLVGERGREVQDFIRDDLGPEGMARAVVVVATSDAAPLLRRQAAWTATAVAEYFRDQGKQVLLMIDSVTRFAMAQREIGLSAGEPPTVKGYPPTVFAELPRLLERAGPGCGTQGDITGIYTVLVDGDDHNEPIADTVRGILDGHVVLDRRIAESGRYPAVDLQRSLSRMLPGCHTPIEREIMKGARRMLGKHGDMEDLIRIGAYRPGSDPDTDAAIRFFAPAEAYLTQDRNDAAPSTEAFSVLYGLLVEAGCDVALPQA